MTKSEGLGNKVVAIDIIVDLVDSYGYTFIGPKPLVALENYLNRIDPFWSIVDYTITYPNGEVESGTLENRLIYRGRR